MPSVDPCYHQPAAAILSQVQDNLDHSRDWLATHTASIDWDYFGSPAARIGASEVAADFFATDYTTGPEHYRAAALPTLPLADDTFDLTLCGNLLFAYDHTLTLDEHTAALLELARVTHGEVRVHPLYSVKPDGPLRYPQLDHVRDVLAQHGVATELRPIASSWIVDARQTLVCTPAR